ncbi:MAG: metallophosphoesterase [Acetatifactor sp.]|nr:metallophosphoesterase [Acetatifactor sp.]
MKILLVSDTHKKNENYFMVVKQVKPDMVIHCGDGEGCEYALTQAADCPVEIVLGNNDFFSDLPRERILDIEGYRIWVTHGHNYYVSMGRETIMREAFARGMDIVCFGHTHRPVVDVADTVTALNPGSLSYPRQEGRRPSYMTMELVQGSEAKYKIYYL